MMVASVKPGDMLDEIVLKRRTEQVWRALGDDRHEDAGLLTNGFRVEVRRRGRDASRRGRTSG